MMLCEGGIVGNSKHNLTITGSYVVPQFMKAEKSKRNNQICIFKLKMALFFKTSVV